MSWLCIPCFPKRRPRSAGSVPSNAPTSIPSPASISGQLPSQNHIPDSQMPSPLQSPAYLQSPGLAPMEQGHSFRPQRHSRSSNQHRRYPQPQNSRRSSRSHNGNGNYDMSQAPPLFNSQNSEPAEPYASEPTYPYAGEDYQPQFAPQSAYGDAGDPSAPMPATSPAPSEAPYGTTSLQYPPGPDAPYEPHEQTRGLAVPQNSRSLSRKPLASRGMDASDFRDSRAHHPQFRHSRCNGRRKALCVGVNYVGQRNSLQGCVDDARNIYEFLMEHHNYPHSDIIVLTDDNQNPLSQPTRTNLLDAMQWLVEDAQPDDALFFHYSGHGGRTRDMDGDEVDGYDDVIFPVDYQQAGIITDDVLHDALVKPLPPGCRLTAVFDSCHSGSILDLVFEFHSNGQLKSGPVTRAFQQAKTSPADVVCFSGCKDSQTSADVVQGGVAVGAMSYAFLKVLKRNPQITYIDLLRGVREILKKKYSQKPQLSATHKVDKDLHFIM